MLKKIAIVSVLCLALTSPVLAQMFDTGQVNNEYARTDGALVGWATQVIASVRGPQDYLQPELGLAAFGMESDVLGDAGTPFSLGDGGSITVAFDMEIANGAGDDFAVFENGFAWNGVYMELGFVEVSSNGMDFARMPAFCRQDSVVGTWDTSESALFYNLAGNFVGGTGLDLQDLVTAGDPLVSSGAVDLDHILFVRVVDVIGDLAGNATQDFIGRPVADPYPSSGEGSGMDVTGFAIINTGVVAIEEASWGSVKSLFR
jgi:hypothetical protein